VIFLHANEKVAGMGTRLANMYVHVVVLMYAVCWGHTTPEGDFEITIEFPCS